MTSYLVIVNPASGRGRARHRADVLRRGLSETCQVEVFETRRRGEAAEVAAGDKADVDRVIAVGGDGTLNEALTGLLEREREGREVPALGFLPSGTANAAIRAFGFATDPDVLVTRLAEGPGRPVDVGFVRHAGGERPFLLWCGAGFDAVVIKALNESRTGLMGLTGLARNLPHVIGMLGRYTVPEIEVEVDGGEAGEASSVVVANVAAMAFGGVVSEDADAFDGSLDVVSLRSSSKLGLVRIGLTMLTSSLHRAEGVDHTRGAHISLSALGEVPFQLDGEPVGVLPATVELKPGAIRLLVP